MGGLCSDSLLLCAGARAGSRAAISRSCASASRATISCSCASSSLSLSWKRTRRKRWSLISIRFEPAENSTLPTSLCAASAKLLCAGARAGSCSRLFRLHGAMLQNTAMCTPSMASTWFSRTCFCMGLLLTMKSRCDPDICRFDSESSMPAGYGTLRNTAGNPCTR